MCLFRILSQVFVGVSHVGRSEARTGRIWGVGNGDLDG